MTDEEHLNHDKLAVLMMTQSEPEANIVKGILEGAGIHCALLTQILHNVYPFTVDGLATIQIRVLDSQLEAARALCVTMRVVRTQTSTRVRKITSKAS